MARHGGLPDALAGPDHRDRRQRVQRVLRRLKPEVRALVPQPGGQRPAREQKALARPQHRLVGHVHDDVGIAEAVFERVEERDAVVRVATELLRPTGEPRADDVVRETRDRVAHHRRVVLTVDDHDRARHRRDVTSPSMRAVYFSNSSVSVAN